MHIEHIFIVMQDLRGAFISDVLYIYFSPGVYFSSFEFIMILYILFVNAIKMQTPPCLNVHAFFMQIYFYV